ncbi:hypothetical protein [Streptomyces tubercidicus]|uniref:hypothetical protein n=1 Tax=Streptomyces tubercidicus TaxID=47759 RepID=UPI00346588FC
MVFLMRLSADELHALHLRHELVATLESAEERLDEGGQSSAGEKRAWKYSLPAVARDLLDAGLGGVDMLIEYRLPGVQGPADVLLAGVHPRTREPSYVVAELKQWKRVQAAPNSDGRFSVENLPGKPKKHPAEQTAAFCRKLLESHAELVGHEERLAGLTYLHNAAESDVADLLIYPRTRLSHIFTRDSRGALMRFLRERLAAAPESETAEHLEKPERLEKGELSVRLDGIDAAGQLSWHDGFRLVSDPAAAQRYVLDVVRAAYAAEHKRVLLLAGVSAAQGRHLATATADLLGRAGYTSRMWSGSRVPQSPLCDVLFCEEASLAGAVGQLLPFEGKEGTSAVVAELIRASRVPVIIMLPEGDVSGGNAVGADGLVRNTARALQVRLERIQLDEAFG